MPSRYVLTMGDSLMRTNRQLLKDAGVDMILITYADIVFSELTLRVLRSVGWILKEVRTAAVSKLGERESDNVRQIAGGWAVSPWCFRCCLRSDGIRGGARLRMRIHQETLEC
jgi:hypothetical protein